MLTILNQYKEWLPYMLFMVVTVLKFISGNANTCNNIPDIENASPRGNSTPPVPISTVIKYSCNRGYEATEGIVSATCKQDGGSITWVFSASKCRPKSCGHPGEVENAQRTGEDFRFGESVKYECYPGYKLKGRPEIYCDSTGDWTASPPRCDIVSCNNPPKPVNGSVRYSSVTYQSEAMYSCDNSFRFVGTTDHTITRQCLANKTWSGIMPVCEEVLCPDPTAVPGVTVTDLSPDKTRHPVGKRIYYHCGNDGVPKPIECTARGEWDIEPQCGKEIYCEDPATPPGIIIVHVAQKEDKHKVNDIIFYQCQSTGARILAKCTSEGTWSVLPGECEAVTPTNATKTTLSPPQSSTQADDLRKTCGEAPPIEHGTVTYLQSKSAIYKCESGFTLKGTDVLTCRSSGEWDAKPPSCKKTSPVGLIVGIVVGVIVLIGTIIGIGVFFHKKRKSTVPGNKKKASPNDAVNMDEVQSLEKNHKPIPVTVL